MSNYDEIHNVWLEIFEIYAEIDRLNRQETHTLNKAPDQASAF
jgi:hypothetical protein